MTTHLQNDQVHALIADDEPEMRLFIADALRSEGWIVSEYNPYEPQPQLLRKDYNVVVLDIVMPKSDGFELRRKIISHSPDAQFIMITAFPDQEKHEQALNCGIYTFLVKPFRAEQIRFAAYGALKKQLACRRRMPCVSVDNPDQCGLIGNSPAMIYLRKQISRIAHSSIPVLISGATGTGKEVVAHAIHRHSQRISAPFIAVNCGALAPSLIESELFGHTKGAFTGASKIKHGFFESAEGGTLFLDEIGELPLELQSRFLRVLDTGEYIRIGETTPRTTDVRIISATNRNLQQMAEAGNFRKDLFFRLRGCVLHLPPLSSRTEDIPLLVRHYLSDGYEIADEVINILKKHDWPGNVRELIMVLNSLESLQQDNIITAKSVRETLQLYYEPETFLPTQPYHEAKNELLRNFDHHYFTALLDHNNGNLSRTASHAQLDRKHLREKLKQLGIYPAGKR